MSALAVVTRPADDDTDDRDLVAAVRAGDERAFEVLFQRYQPRVGAYVRRRVRDHGRAEDITQEVFIAALRRIREESEREILFKPWIFEIAKNRCIDLYRRTRNAHEISFDARDAIGADEHGRLAEPGPTPDSAVEGKAAIDNLCGAFGGLSPVHHEILVLREFEGLSYRQIGERLGMSRAAVESTLFRARKRLSEEYEELVSGERCVRVQRIVDASGGRSAGLRDQRRTARHLAHCQPCRRYARRAGVELGPVSRPAAAAARIAAFLPLPSFLRRRWAEAEATPLLGQGGQLGQWSANVAPVMDPGLVSSWAKAVATAATVAVAGIGAGGAFTEPAPGGLLSPGAPFAQAPGLELLRPGGDRRDTAPAHAKRAPVATAPARFERPAQRAADRAPAGAAATAAATRGGRAPAGDAPARPAQPDAGDPPVGGGRSLTEIGRGPAAPEPGDPVGQAIGSVGTAGGETPSPGNSVREPDAPGVVQGVAAPVTAAPAPNGEAGDAPLEQVHTTAPTVTGAVGSVPPTVPQAPASTTTALHDVGG